VGCGEVLDGHRGDRAHLDDARVVHHHIQPAEPVEDRTHEIVDLSAVGYIADHRMHVGAAPGQVGFRDGKFGAIAGTDRQPEAAGRQFTGDQETQAAGTATDQSDAAGRPASPNPAHHYR
jgi:hypothetical protein